MSKKINYEGKKFGILTVVEFTGEYHPSYSRKSKIYLCRCECGTICKKAAASFGSTKSCGCLQAQVKERFKTMNIGRKPQTQLPDGISSFNVLLHQYKRSAQKRKVPYELTNEQFRNLVGAECCFYCGSNEKRKVFSRKTAAPFLCFGIDRVDNKQGYIPSNCVPCCKVCNRAKDVLTQEEFMSWVLKVCNHLRLPLVPTSG
jgi:hypothetical protein